MKNRISKNINEFQLLKLNDISLNIYQDENIYNMNICSTINISDSTLGNVVDDIIGRNILAWKELSKL
jgi:hypothetical protein